MEYLSLEKIFGVGASQNTDSLTIQKSSLLSLTPTANNGVESLLAAVLITALQNFQGVITDENNQPITDENNQPITFDNSEVFELLKMIAWKPFQVFRNQQPYINHQIIISNYVQYQPFSETDRP
jgi:hypothetical protein